MGRAPSKYPLTRVCVSVPSPWLKKAREVAAAQNLSLSAWLSSLVRAALEATGHAK